MKIYHEGADISQEVSVCSAIYTEYADSYCDKLDILFNDCDKLWSVWSPEDGDKSRCEHNGFDTFDMYVDELTQENGKFLISSISVHQDAKTQRQKTWDEVRLFEIASEIAGKYSLSFESYDADDRFYDKVRQNWISDLELLSNICTQEGYGFKISMGKLIIYGQNALENQSPAAQLELTDMDEYEFIKITSDIYDECQFTSPLGTQTFSAPDAKGSKILKVSGIRAATAAEASRFAKGMLRSANRNKFIGKIKTDLRTDLAAGSVVEVKSNSMVNFPMFIYKIEHDFTQESSRLYLRKPLEGY